MANKKPGLAAIGKRDKATKKISYSCPIGVIGLAGLLPGVALPTKEQLVAACCTTNVGYNSSLPPYYLVPAFRF
jgi:hypothetical protein